jgi:ankyrin repeat protein
MVNTKSYNKHLSKKTTKKNQEQPQDSAFKNTFKICFGIACLLAIPIILYSPEFSIGPLDGLRKEFFKTELILNGYKYSTDGFIKAIQDNDLRKVKLFIRSDIDMDNVGSKGLSPLCVAAQSGNEKIVDFMINNRANVLQKNTIDGLTPVFCAVDGKNINIMNHFFKSGISYNTRSANGLTLLQYATLTGNTEILSYLLKVGADPNMQNKYGQTALHYAVSQDNVLVINILLNAGAIVDMKDSYGISPLELAVRLGKDNYTSLLSRYSHYSY